MKTDSKGAQPRAALSILFAPRGYRVCLISACGAIPRTRHAPPSGKYLASGRGYLPVCKVSYLSWCRRAQPEPLAPVS